MKSPTQLFVRDAAEFIASAADFSTFPGNGYSKPVSLEQPGADLTVYLSATREEAAAFRAGIEAVSPGDDVTVQHEVHPDGHHVVIVCFGDSDDDHARVSTKDGPLSVPLAG